jgi:hypothetical protein
VIESEMIVMTMIQCANRTGHSHTYTRT